MEEGINRQPEFLIGTRQSKAISACIVLIILLAIIFAINAVDRHGSIDGVLVFSRQSRGHNDQYKYEQSDLPPVGGIHNSQFQNCGIYVSPITSEKAIHSLEHGAIWITYDPDLSSDEVALLQEKVRGSEYILLSPYPGQRNPVVLTAWGAQLRLDTVADPRMDQFLTRYLLGPAIPERGASCKGGFGQPLS